MFQNAFWGYNGCATTTLHSLVLLFILGFSCIAPNATSNKPDILSGALPLCSVVLMRLRCVNIFERMGRRNEYNSNQERNSLW